MKISSNNLRLIRNRFIFLSIILIALIVILLSRSFYLQYMESDFLNAEGDKKTRSWFTNDRRYSLVVRATF